MAKRPGKRQRHPLSDLDSARANLLHASQLGFWKTEEAAAFSMGYDPKFLNPVATQAHLAGTDEAKEFQRRIELIERAIQMEDLKGPIRPEDLVSWATRRRLELPHELISLSGATEPGTSSDPRIAALEGEVHLLRGKCAEQERQLAEPHRRRLLSIFKLISGMAEGGYAYQPASARNTATSTIKRDMQKIGLDLDEAVILEILREASKQSRR